MSEYHKLIGEIPESLHEKYMIMIMKELDKHDECKSEKLLKHLKDMDSYDNYISSEEYDELIGKLYNPKGIIDNFNCSELEVYLTNNGYKLEYEGKYNKYALFLAINYIKNLHCEFIEQLVSSGRYNKPSVCYQLAIDHLLTNKKGWIRDLFCL